MSFQPTIHPLTIDTCRTLYKQYPTTKSGFNDSLRAIVREIATNQRFVYMYTAWSTTENCRVCKVGFSNYPYGRIGRYSAFGWLLGVKQFSPILWSRFSVNVTYDEYSIQKKLQDDGLLIYLKTNRQGIRNTEWFYYGDSVISTLQAIPTQPAYNEVCKVLQQVYEVAPQFTPEYVLEMIRCNDPFTYDRIVQMGPNAPKLTLN